MENRAIALRCVAGSGVWSLLLAVGLAAQEPTPELYQRRFARHESLPRPTAKAIVAGLAWLARHQDSDGGWDCDGFMKHDPEADRCQGPGNPVHDVGITGLALLAFLGDGNTLKRGVHQEVVVRGAGYLVKQQQAKGEHRGLIGANASMDYIYDHMYASYALVEAYGLSRSAALLAPARAAVRYVESHRHKDYAWRYKRQGKSPDTPVTVLAWMVLRSAQEFGISIGNDHRSTVATWLDKVTSPNGITGYSQAGTMSSRHPGDHAQRFPAGKTPTLSAAALTCRFLLGLRLDEQVVMEQQVKILRAHAPRMHDFYYWYYGSLALRQVGGEVWSRWAKAVRGKLLPLQRRTASAAGSWDPNTVWGEDGGRVYTTALAVLVLESEYRYAPLSECTPVPTGLPRFGMIRRKWRNAAFGEVARASKRLAAERETLTEPERLALAALDTALQIEVERALHRVERLGKGPDFLGARDSLKRLAKEFAGLDPARRASAMLGRFSRDKSIKREILAMSLYRKAIKKRRGQLAGLRKVVGRYPGTHAAKLSGVILQGRMNPK